MEAKQSATTPQILEIELRGEHMDWRRRSWSHADSALDRVGRWSGTALGLALLTEAARAGDEAPFVLCVGDCVARGLPTAARASVLARAPLTGRVGQGQVGGQLGRRLARVCAALSLRGRTHLPGAVLHLDGAGAVQLLTLPALAGAAVQRTQELLDEHFGPCVSLRIGPAGEAGVAFANLAAGAQPASYVGRGGLGAALGRHGIKAIVVTAEPVPDAPLEGAVAQLHAALSDSPRLEARAAGGTLESAPALAARGALNSKGQTKSADLAQGRKLLAEAEEQRTGRKGCKGCPTPCGWVFDDGSGARRGVHFSAHYPLGLGLGLEGLSGGARLLARCDELGLDAKETGAVLALRAEAQESGRLSGEPAWGKVELFLEQLDALCTPVKNGGEQELEAMRHGLAAFARALDMQAKIPLAGGEAARKDSNLATVLGQAAGLRGADPMRSFTFLIGEGSGRARLESLLAPLPLPTGTEDPEDPRGKGRALWWHENLVTAVDALGFCAFSASGLLADGLADLSTLADWIAPSIFDGMPGSELQPGAQQDPAQRFLDAGASLVLLTAELAEHWESAATRAASSSAAGGLLDAPGMLPEYRLCRGFDEHGRLLPATRRRIGSAAHVEYALRVLKDGTQSAGVSGGSQRPQPSGTQQPGHILLRSSGPLAELLGRDCQLALDLPCTLSAALHVAAAQIPGAARLLLSGSEPLPAVYCDGRRITAETRLLDGQTLDLVLAVAGG